jgi:uncharacterized damage-inducible protein DinB
MESAHGLAARAREVLLDGTWIANTNWMAQIKACSWEEAQRSVANLNSIYALTFHVHYYLAGILECFQTGRLEISDRYSFEAPPLKTQADWDGLRDRFARDAEAFSEAVERMSESQLEAVFVDPRYGSYRRNIEGFIEHAYYHLGQVSLIRKLLAAATP